MLQEAVQEALQRAKTEIKEVLQAKEQDQAVVQPQEITLTHKEQDLVLDQPMLEGIKQVDKVPVQDLDLHREETRLHKGQELVQEVPL